MLVAVGMTNIMAASLIDLYCFRQGVRSVTQSSRHTGNQSGKGHRGYERD